ncbi:MAG: hypothetical protein DRG39_07830 [Deltaproteobacteria bacterium]|nr:MAG: hypothetical protein DRG39_07830 [Deltaproteobacteria bacterium]
MIHKKVFKEIGLLEESYFLYFEDNDLCKRAKEAGWMILYNPQSKVYHKGGTSIGKWLKTPISAYYGPRNFLYHNASAGISDCFKRLENKYWQQLKKSPDCLKAFVEGIKDFLIGKKGKVSPEQLDPKKWEHWPNDNLRKAANELINNPDQWALLKFLSLSQGIFFRKEATGINAKNEARSCCIEGERLFEKGDIDKAISIFEKAIRLDPLCAQAYNNLAAIYWQRQDRERALHYIEKAVKLSPSDLDVLWNYKQIMLGFGFIKEAQKINETYRLLESIGIQKQE